MQNHAPSKREQGRWGRSEGEHTEPSARSHSLSSSFSFTFLLVIHPFVHPFGKYLLSIYDVPQTVLDVALSSQDFTVLRVTIQEQGKVTLAREGPSLTATYLLLCWVLSQFLRGVISGLGRVNNPRRPQGK